MHIRYVFPEISKNSVLYFFYITAFSDVIKFRLLRLRLAKLLRNRVVSGPPSPKDKNNLTGDGLPLLRKHRFIGPE